MKIFAFTLCVVLAGYALAGETNAQSAGEQFVIPLEEDTLLFIENRGVTRILATLNGFPFKLASDSAEVAEGDNTFPIPLDGVLTINMAAYMQPGFDNNIIEFITQGPPGSDWEFIIAPVFVQGQTEAAYRLDGLEPFPQAFTLLQSYPNPFIEATRFTFSIPEDRITGLAVSLVVYDVLGRRVRSLLDGRRFPGTFTVRWDGRDGRGQPVPAGLYLGRLEAGGFSRTVRLTRVR